MPRMASKIIVAVGVTLSMGFSPAMASAAPVTADPAVDVNLDTVIGSAALDLTRVLLKCLTTGTSVLPGDPMGLPVACV